MRLCLAWVLLALVASQSLAMSATYYADPAGSGTTCSSGSPCTVATAIAKPLVAGDVLNLKDGVFTGDSGMVWITSKNGSAGNLITIQAVNDGAVTIDGQNSRVPLDLFDSTYVSIQGVNFKNSNSDTCKIRSTPGTPLNAHHELRRIICWDAVDADNRHAISVHDINDVLLEDVAGFGRARKTLATFETNRITWRRCWSRWNKYADAQPKQGADLVYDAYDNLFENCLFEWDQLDTSTNQLGNANSAGGFLSGSRVGNLTVLGSIAYALTGQNNSQPYLFFMPAGSVDAGVTGSTFRHNVGLVQPSGLSIYPFFLNDSEAGGSDTADHLTSITGTGGHASSYTGNWSCTNCLEQATVSTYNLYTNSGAGATIRYRYVDGTLTGTELWPFPMADRIAAALTDGGYASHNVNTVIQSLFGSFPTQDAGAVMGRALGVQGMRYNGRRNGW